MKQLPIMKALGAMLALAAAPAANAAISPDDAAAFEDLRQMDLRVANIAYSLASSNAALCGKAVAPQSGFVLHGLAQYDVRDRATVADHFALGEAPGVMGVVPGAAADLAGLRADDSLLSANGRSLVFLPTKARRPARDPIEQASVILDEEMAKGPVTLRYSRMGRVAETVLRPVMACASQVELLANDEMNAWADGRHIMVGAPMLEASESDDALAFVIAHEMAHNVLIATTGEQHSRVAEGTADRLALRIAKGAGYDAQRAVAAWAPYFRRAGPSLTHPGAGRRLAMLAQEMAAAEEP